MKKHPPFFVWLLVGVTLLACSFATEALDAQATETAGDTFASQTASAPTPTPTPTRTPTPTPTPTPSSSPMPQPTDTGTPTPTDTEAPPTETPTPTVEGQSELTISTTGNFLFVEAVNQLSEGFSLTKFVFNPNEDVAKLYDDPEAHLQRLEEWGREIGYYETYEISGDCEQDIGLFYVDFSVVQLTNSDGAQRYVEWVKPRDETVFETTASIIDDIGEYGYWVHGIDDIGCGEGGRPGRSVSVTFR